MLYEKTKSNKIGRNDKCPCGSGLKYKKCHCQQTDSTRLAYVRARMQREISQREAKDKAWKSQYGHIRSTISANHEGKRVVAVGNQVYASENWKTFHDFLFDYIKTCLGSDWGETELKKPYPEMHPVLHWYKAVCEFQRSNAQQEQEIYSAICTGPVGAYLSLAYDLYALRHHSLLQKRLIERLKIRNQFQGAQYEIFIAAVFIKAGFDISFEDEQDRTTSHCEFVATHKSSGAKYSVEAKSRHRKGHLGQDGPPLNHDKIRLRVGQLLRDALKKEAAYPRIVLIDINMPPEDGKGPFEKRWFKPLANEISRIEQGGIDGKSAPPAYLIFTNHPYHYVGDGQIEPEKNFMMTAINIENFKRDKLEIAASANPQIFALWGSINAHTKVPHDFDE